MSSNSLMETLHNKSKLVFMQCGTVLVLVFVCMVGRFVLK
jgi:hypothetical protein